MNVAGLCDVSDRHVDRRALLLSSAALAGLVQVPRATAASSIEIVSDTTGFGTHEAGKGDLVLLHYIGYVDGTDKIFDSTKGGLNYRDGGAGVFRPTIIRLGGDPVPGICAGLQQGIQGMRIGGKRTVIVPPELGFGSSTVLAPYAILPGGSTLRYEIEVLRLSTRGPDELTQGLDRCGTGGASETAEKCDQITPLEVV